MIDIILALASLCKLAIEGRDKGLEEYKRRTLSEAEKELLIAAAKDGKFLVIHLNEVPNCIRAGGKDFIDHKAGDPAIAAKFFDAFRNLCKRGYVERDDGILFRLTHTGFEKARQLASKTDKKKANKH